MANIDVLNLSEEIKADGATGASLGVSEGAPPSQENVVVPGPSERQNGEASPVSASPVSGSTSLRASPAHGQPSGSNYAPTLSMPHPKKFSHSNINKKFLEKTSSTSPSGQTLSASVTAKIGSSTQKPAIQTATSHSRLVTAKLTAIAQSSTTTGPGWSRPSSSVSSGAPTPSATNLKASPLPTSPANLQPPPIGKVIQPQPRGASEAFVGVVKKDSTGKAAWGNTRGAAAVVAKLDAVANDFPTAAEVAQGRTVKMFEMKQVADAAAAQKQAVAAEEDGFRGVHLNPNAHHWDEMEEDDDNFLGGVIEFGDGRQYKIQPNDGPQQSSPPGEPPELAMDGEVDSTKHSEAPPTVDQPVSKEERFADDFDRSWPRSRIVTAIPQTQRDQQSNGTPSSTSSTSMHSPQDPSRVLFNERSNRLEPYSSSHPQHRQNGTGPAPYLVRRGSRSDKAVSPTELRGVRDAPPHVHTQGVQLLQKTTGSGELRSEGGFHAHVPVDHSEYPATSPVDGSRFRDREPPRRDSALSPALSRTSSQGFSTRSKDHYSPYAQPPIGSGSGRDTEDRQRRLSTMGPPPLPMPSSKDSGREPGRQLPPHLSNIRPPPFAASRTLSGPESKQSAPTGPIAAPPLAAGPTSPLPITLSPLSVHAPISPFVVEKSLPSSTMPLAAIDEVRKAAMQSAADRARLRRQQEEEEREKDKERARKKAAELEEKMKTRQEQGAREKSGGQEAVSEAQVVEIIEEAIQNVKPNPPDISSAAAGEGGIQPGSSARPSFPRAPSLKGAPRPDHGRRTSFTASAAPSETQSIIELESWRTKAPRRTSMSRPATAVLSSTPLPPPPLLAEVSSLDVKPSEDLEVFDFAELGRLVGAEEVPKQVAPPEPDSSQRLPSRHPRAVATDFFDDDGYAQVHTAPSDEGSWRRKPDRQSDQVLGGSGPALSPAPKEKLTVQITPMDPSKTPGSATSHTMLPPHQHKHHDEPRLHVGTVPGHQSHGPQRSPLTPSYREAPMSALNDVMSRIKGALDGMHTKEEPAPPPPPKLQKWLPPALRPKQLDFEPSIPSEVFDTTGLEPPRSPRPAWNVYTVKLPRVPRAYEPISKQQLVMSQSANTRWSEVFTWDPPLGGDTPTNILFRKPPVNKGRTRYYVVLPRFRRTSLRTIPEDVRGPVVNLPPSSAPAGPRNRHSGTQETHSSSNWRKASSSTLLEGPQSATVHVSSVLDTTSRSPPPETPSAPSSVPSLPKSEAVPSHTASAVWRSQPKMTVGSDVAFYRDARVDDAIQPAMTVNFIVTSELDDEGPSETKSTPIGASSARNGTSSEDKKSIESFVSTSTDSKVDPGKAVLPPERVVITPPPHVSSSPWVKSPRAFPVKESPSRAPDPEHLKAVWSQASNKAELPSVNSLEAIADDLTTVPFTLQDVKSEDGETPPPSGSGPPSRMSLHEVTRAFQQVPSPSVTSPHRGTVGPPLTSPPHGPVPRPNFAYAPAMPAPSVRPTYGYPSPMLSHTPSPTIMYPYSAPSPVSRPMAVNGPPSPFAQPMWMPLPGPASQPPGTMMRPMASPYPAQLMPYPSPGGPVPMYAVGPPSLQNHSTQPSHATQNRAPGMPMMSPVMQPAHAAHPMYASSPVMMHSPSVVPVPPPHNYSGVPANRGQLRGNFDHTSGLSTSMGHPSQPSGPYVIAPNSFARPAW